MKVLPRRCKSPPHTPSSWSDVGEFTKYSASSSPPQTRSDSSTTNYLKRCPSFAHRGYVLGSHRRQTPHVPPPPPLSERLLHSYEHRNASPANVCACRRSLPEGRCRYKSQSVFGSQYFAASFQTQSQRLELSFPCPVPVCAFRYLLLYIVFCLQLHTSASGGSPQDF